MLENTPFKKFVQSNLANKLPELMLSGFMQFDNEDLATFTTLTHLTKIQSFFLQSSAMPIVNLIPKLTNLKALCLASPNIVIEPNPFFRSLTNLTHLDIQIQTNKHIKTEDLVMVTQLRRFFITFQLESEFPTSLLKLTDLHYLRLKKCLTIPPAITKFVNLSALELDSCTHILPSELALMTQLEKLQIRAVASMTNIPDVIFQMTWLTSLHFSLLANVKYIPPKISRLVRLEALVLTHSCVVTVPYEDLTELTQLQFLHIEGLSCKWTPPQLAVMADIAHVQGGSNIPSHWKERRHFHEFSIVHLDLYDD